MTEILGVKVDNLTQSECLSRIENWLNQDRQRYIVTVNPEFVIEAQKNANFKQVLNRSDLAICDGAGILFASRFLKKPLKQKIAGADLMVQICVLAQKRNLPVFLLGAGPGVAQKAAENLKKIQPDLKIGFSSNQDKIPFISRPTILFVALGAPKQEEWIAKNLKLMPQVKLAMGVGGSFDYLAGRVVRAPRMVRRANLEWLWRLFLEPRRAKRIYQAVVKFPLMVAIRARKAGD